MSETIFSKIITGEIPSFKIYENDYVYAFLDISQVTKGHTLLIPKKASANIFETDEETMKHIGVALPKVANAIKKHLILMVLILFKIMVSLLINLYSTYIFT